MKPILVMLMLSVTAIGQRLDDDMWLKHDLGSQIVAERPKKPLCNVPLDGSPMVRGKYRLGMSREAFDAAAGSVVRLADGSALKRADDVSTAPTFFEGRLIRLKVVYHTDAEWDSAAEFAYVVGTEFRLPVAAWRANGYRDGVVMFCDGWTVLAESNRLDLRDEAAIARMRKSAADAKVAESEAKKKTFKP